MCMRLYGHAPAPAPAPGPAPCTCCAGFTVESVLDHRNVMRPAGHAYHQGGVRGAESTQCELCKFDKLEPSDGKSLAFAKPAGAAASVAAKGTAAAVAMTEFLIKWEEGSHLWNTWECAAIFRNSTYRGRLLKASRLAAVSWCLLQQLCSFQGSSRCHRPTVMHTGHKAILQLQGPCAS